MSARRRLWPQNDESRKFFGNFFVPQKNTRSTGIVCNVAGEQLWLFERIFDTHHEFLSVLLEYRMIFFPVLVCSKEAIISCMTGLSDLIRLWLGFFASLIIPGEIHTYFML